MIKEPIKFPSINKGPQQSVLMQDAEENENDDDAESTDTPHLTRSDGTCKQTPRYENTKNISTGALLIINY